MKLTLLIGTLTLLLLMSSFIDGHILRTTLNHVQVKNPEAAGFWEKKVIWKPRWVKSWTEKKYYIPLWKKVWGPIISNEWVPLPKPPPGWLHKHGHLKQY